ncbi:uncharacterized protein PV09_02892 [Verruconis gallopava]|uniref:2EXR domain-containing protein n=1 Tax=Verruconis gallopava TaxID=253628 RepID=A0A0D2AHT5_9PEZI|nr:uncharacterized protein PV09_02892 [Verruconis gallopava]KIW06448.1 hypothetical protein PV09_02892 [Verruconis gallopava]
MSLFAHVDASTEGPTLSENACSVDSNSSELIADRYPKRKRAQLKYIPADSEDDWSSIEEEEEYDVQVKKKARPSPKNLPRRKVFPFMRLPAELRNKIYEYALSDKDPIYVSSRTKGYRRWAQRCTETEISPQFVSRWTRYRHRQDGENKNEDPSDRRALVPNLLAVSKTIHDEAGSFLYGQRIVIADNYALMAFLLQIGPTHVRMLRDLTIIEWCGGRAHKSINFPAIAMLAPATDLRRLNISCSVGYFSSYSWGTGKKQEIAHRVARKIFRDCYPFLQAYGTAKRDMTAAVNVIEIDENNFRYASADKEKEMEKFRTELGRLLRT